MTDSLDSSSLVQKEACYVSTVAFASNFSVLLDRRKPLQVLMFVTSSMASVSRYNGFKEL